MNSLSNSTSLEKTFSALSLEPLKLPGYVINTPFKVDSESEEEDSSAEEWDNTFPMNVDFFRLLPKEEVKTNNRRGTVLEPILTREGRDISQSKTTQNFVKKIEGEVVNSFGR